MTALLSGPGQRRALAAGAAVLAAAAVGVLAPPAVHAAEPGRAPSGCLDRPSSQARADRAPDMSTTPSAVLRGIERDLDQRVAAAPLLTSALPSLMTVKVHAHAIGGRTSDGASRRQVRRQVDVLNRAHRGGQSTSGVPTPFRFELASYERVRNERWRTAGLGSPADKEMRRALHTGGRAVLDLYVTRPAAPDDGSGQMLGWSSSPWELADHPRLDGVTIHQGTLPGGALAGYGRGDTAVHEVGHWLGLLHTFEGGCAGPGDLVDDTPAEASASHACDLHKDTCAAPGRDPVHNFMDYAYDSCMDRFTRGQVHRMTDNWLAYRTP